MNAIEQRGAAHTLGLGEPRQFPCQFPRLGVIPGPTALSSRHQAPTRPLHARHALAGGQQALGSRHEARHGSPTRLLPRGVPRAVPG